MSRGVQLVSIFEFLDGAATAQRTAEAHIVMGNGESLTVRAGGPGVHAWPTSAPYESYEVLLDHEPARFWTRFTDGAGVLYAAVPRLLVTHHIVRRGGIKDVLCELRKPIPRGVLQMEIAGTSDSERAVWRAIRGIKDVSLVSSRFVLQE